MKNPMLSTESLYLFRQSFAIDIQLLCLFYLREDNIAFPLKEEYTILEADIFVVNKREIIFYDRIIT